MASFPSAAQVLLAPVRRAACATRPSAGGCGRWRSRRRSTAHRRQGTEERSRGQAIAEASPSPVAQREGVSYRDRIRDKLAARDLVHPPPPSPVLRDKHGRFHDYLRISITDTCNLRCTYCAPEEGFESTPKAKSLQAPEVARLARLFVGQGVRKIRLTGGEPTVRKDLMEIMDDLHALQPLGLRQIAMTSNGLTLARKLPDLIRRGLTHLNLSLDTLDPFKFELMTKNRGHHQVMRTIDRALELDVNHVKINVVVINGLNDMEVLDFVEMTRERPVDVRFIEYMPFDGNRWSTKKLVPYRELLERIQREHPELVKLSDDSNDTSKAYKVPGFAGQLGFITSMTDDFCGTCNRIRLTADGNLKVCLFGANEVSLRDMMRSGATDDELLEVVGAAVGRKAAKHAGMIELSRTQNRPMISIGG